MWVERGWRVLVCMIGGTGCCVMAGSHTVHSICCTRGLAMLGYLAGDANLSA